MLKSTEMTKDLGHFWSGYTRMLVYLQLIVHLPILERLKSKVMGLILTCCKCHLDIGTMTTENVPHSFYKVKGVTGNLVWAVLPTSAENTCTCPSKDIVS